MQSTLLVGETAMHRYRVPVDKTVPQVYPESDLFSTMPQVLPPPSWSV